MLHSLLTLFFLLISFNAHSACSTPTGTQGELRFLDAINGLRWCDGTTWMDARVNTLLSCPAGEIGKFTFDSGTGGLSYCDGSFWQSMKGPVSGLCIGGDIGMIKYRPTGFVMEYCDGVFWNAMISTPSPVVNSFAVSSGSSPYLNNNLPFSLGSTLSDSTSRITHFCFKYSLNATVPTAPIYSDSCWNAFSAPLPGITPSQNVSFSNFYSLIGFTPGTYNIFTWTKTGANQISALSNSGNGTVGVDKITLNYAPNPPPVVINAIAVSTDTPSDPISSADLVVPSGQPVYVKWKATAAAGFPAGPITISYTTDEINYTTIATGQSNTVNGACSVDGSTHSGCYVFSSSPTSAYFRIRVSAVDVAGTTSFASTPGVNTTPFNTLAGNTDTGLGGSAASAIFYNYVSPETNDAQALAVASDGTVFFRDIQRGILKISPTTGNVTSFIPYTNTLTNGAIGTATLLGQFARITMDYNNRLLIYDVNFIRRVDLTTNQVTTIAGGGGSTASGTNALSFAMGCHAAHGSSCPIQPAPNGDFYFLKEGAHTSSPAGGMYIWRYQASDQKIYSIIPSGTGTSNNATLPLSTSSLTGFGFTSVPATQTIDKFYATFRHEPCVGCGYSFQPAELNVGTWESKGYGYQDQDSYAHMITALSGDLYLISHRSSYLKKYNSGANTWTPLLGTGTIGVCADDTIATSCNVNIQDAFVTAQGKVYFSDNGLIRTIDDTGKVKTLFGQRKSFGDGGLAMSARFNNITSIAISPAGKIAIVDKNENLIREFSAGGVISKLIGNGVYAGAADGALGASTNYAAGYWGNSFQVFYKSDEDFYFHDWSYIFRYNRSNGTITRVVGAGGTSYRLADGLTGSSVALDGYPMQLVGYNGTKILGMTNQWNGTGHMNNYIKAYDETNLFSQEHLIGNAGNISINGFSVDGTSVDSAQLPLEYNNRVMAGHWDAADGAWYFVDRGSATIRKIIPGGTIETLGNVPRGINAWTYLRNASNHRVVYYCDGSRMYKYNFNTSTETTLPWPSSSISCAGSTVARHPSRNSIVFAMVQNGLMGVAEIVDTP